MTWVITLLLIICPSSYKARPDHFIGPSRSWFYIVCPQYETQLPNQIFLWAGLNWAGSQANNPFSVFIITTVWYYSTSRQWQWHKPSSLPACENICRHWKWHCGQPPRLADAFLVMFGLIYALHLSHPMGLTNTFDFIQKILLGMEDGKLSPKLQTLKNDLLMKKSSLTTKTLGES